MTEIDAPLARHAATPGADHHRVRVRVWDLPTRVFHWALAALILCAVVSAKLGAGAIELHMKFGTAVLALLLFRVAWGVVGGYWSRFAQWRFSVDDLRRDLSGQRRSVHGRPLDVGHSPTGVMAVLAMLALLAIQVATGLVADDEIATVGPLNRFVATATAAAATAWHKGWGQWLILGMVTLHIAAIGFYAFRGRGLVGAMVSGDKELNEVAPASPDGRGQRLLAAGILAICLAAAGWIWRLG